MEFKAMDVSNRSDKSKAYSNYSPFSVSSVVAVFFGVMTFSALLWQRFTGVQALYDHNPFLGLRQPNSLGGNNALCSIQFPGLTPLVVGVAMAYHSNNPVLGLVGSFPLWMANTVNAQALPSLIDFNKTLPLNLGFILQGGAADEYVGHCVANAGDVNGDGKSDLIIGAYQANPGGRSLAGAAYLIYGATNLPATIDLANLGSIGVTLQGGAAGDRAGWSVAGAGDVNGDGKSDFIIGANYADPGGRNQAGAVYLIYGAANLATTINLGSLGSAGVTLQGGAANDYAGGAVASAGDINGDGKSDFIIGAWTASPGGRSKAGAAYLIYGAGNLPTTINLGSLTGAIGLIVQGAAVNDQAGYPVASAGDINGDGKSDFLVGATYADPIGRSQAGAAYLIYGSSNLSATIDLGNLGTSGMTLQGAAANDQAGFTVASAGDVNGDGRNDFIVGAYQASSNEFFQAGSAYLVYGATNLPATMDLGTLGAAGVILQGAAASDYAGVSVASVGDINGDGKGDFIVGADGASPNGRSLAGAGYLIYGATNLPEKINLGSLGTTGVTLQGGAVNDQLGRSVASAGDVNGDGGLDLMVGAWQASPGGHNTAGVTYVVYGPPLTKGTTLTSTISRVSSTAQPTPTQNTYSTVLSGTLTTTTSGTLQTTEGSANTTSQLSNVISTQGSSDSTSIAVSQTVSAQPTSIQTSTPTSPSAVTTSDGNIMPSSSTQLLVTKDSTVPAANSPASNVTPIIAGVVGGGLLLAACLAGVGIYACRKKSSANNANTNKSQAGMIAAGIQMSDYASVRPLDDAAIDQSVNTKSNEPSISAEANYAKIDELKNLQMQYDLAPLVRVDDLKMTT